MTDPMVRAEALRLWLQYPDKLAGLGSHAHLRGIHHRVAVSGCVPNPIKMFAAIIPASVAFMHDLRADNPWRLALALGRG